MPHLVMRRHSWMVVAVVLIAACLRREIVRPELDTDATFGAHSIHGGLAIDRLEGGSTGMIEARGGGWGAPPRFVVRAGDRTIGAVWLLATARTVAGPGATSSSATVAVEPEWPDQAIRLTIRTTSGVLRTGAFERVDLTA